MVETLQPKMDSDTEPVSSGEIKTFQQLQARLPSQFRRVFPNESALRTVVIVPSLTLDQDVMAKISGITHYEERMLCLLLLLRFPRTKVGVPPV